MVHSGPQWSTHSKNIKWLFEPSNSWSSSSCSVTAMSSCQYFAVAFCCNSSNQSLWSCKWCCVNICHSGTSTTQMRFPSRAVTNLHTSVAFFDKTVTSCDSCNCCSSCRNHSSQKCELCTECRTSKKPIGRLVNKHPHVRLTCRPTYYSVQLEARKRRLFHYLGSMVFCNKSPWRKSIIIILRIMRFLQQLRRWRWCWR